MIAFQFLSGSISTSTLADKAAGEKKEVSVPLRFDQHFNLGSSDCWPRKKASFSSSQVRSALQQALKKMSWSL